MSVNEEMSEVSEQVAATLGQLSELLRDTEIRFQERRTERHYEGLQAYALCGPSRCGKDYAGKWLGVHTDLKYGASLSWHLCRIASPILGVPRRKLYRVRHKYFAKLRAIALALDKLDATLLVRMALADSDIVTGPRSRAQLRAAKAAGYVAEAVWIEREGLLPDPTLEITAADCDCKLSNPGTAEGFGQNLRSLFESKNVFRCFVQEEEDDD